MSIKFSDVVDNNVVCYLPFDPDDISKNYGNGDLEILSRQNILTNNIPGPQFSECKSMTTDNIENNDFYRINWNFDQKIFSIEFWFNFNQIGKKDDWFFRVYLEEDSIDFYRHILSDNTYYISMDEDSELSNYKILSQDTWYHFCAERDLENKTLRFYINGEIQISENFDDTDSIKNVIFYTGWGSNYSWQCNYTNIIISDIIRYGELYFIPSMSLIPSFKHNYSNNDLLYKNLVEKTNKLQCNRKISKEMNNSFDIERIVCGTEVKYKFDTLFTFIKDDGNINTDTYYKNTVNIISNTDLARNPITLNVRKVAFIFTNK